MLAISAILRALLEFIVSVLRAVLLPFAFLLVVLEKLLAWIKWLCRTRTLKPLDEEGSDCGRIPPALIRRPDPCIYSQSYLAAQELPVTWNNPDIWVAPAAEPAAVQPDSYHLTEDTDYIVSVRAHNASTDAAIGVGVRLVYRPWSFGSAEMEPVEVDASGDEVVRSVDIGPMGSAVTTFAWHTPALAAGEKKKHFCLQAQLSHPLDLNPANNVGQENTDVYGLNPGSVKPGETVGIDVPVANTARRERRLRFSADAYEIDSTDQVRLRRREAHGRMPLSLAGRFAHSLPTVEIPERRRAAASPGDRRQAEKTRVSRSRATLGGVAAASPKSRARLVKTRYEGFAELRQAILGRDYSLPPGMAVEVTAAAGELRLGPAETLETQVEVKIPNDATPGSRLPLNVRAEDGDGRLLGGVTIYFDVEGS